jgi:hypothetical protein
MDWQFQTHRHVFFYVNDHRKRFQGGLAYLGLDEFNQENDFGIPIFKRFHAV